MIAVDTNVLIRLFVADDPRQHGAAKAFFAKRGATSPGFLSLVLIAETCWVLNHVYKLAPAAMRTALLGVIDSEQVVVERPGILRAALAHASTDVADWLIHLLGQEAGCTSTVTFDRKFARYPGVELLD